MRTKLGKVAARTSLLYGIIAGFWILLSDRLVISIVSDPVTIGRLSTYKGWGFVAVTASLLYITLRSQLYRWEQETAGRIAAEEALKESEGELRALFAGMTDIILVLDAEGRYVKIAPTDPMNLYRPSEEMLGRKIHEILPKADADQILHQIETALRLQQTINFEYKLDIGSREVWFDARISPLKENRVFWIARDITKRKQAEEALRESEEKYRRLHESMTEAFAIVDVDGRIQESNRAYQSMLGYSEEELRRLTYSDITPEKWHAFEKRIVEEQILVQGRADVYEKEYRRKDGTVFPVELSTFLIRNDAGKPAGIWAIVRDITGRKRTEQELVATKDYLRTVFNNVYDAITIHDLDGKVRDVNDKMLEMYGVSREEAIELDVLRDLSVTDESMEESLSNWKSIISGENLFVEWKARRPKDGSVFDVEVFLTRLLLPEGDFILANVRDITKRKQAEEALRQSEERFAIAFRSSPDAMIISHESDGKIIDVNRRWESLTGYGRTEVLDQSSSSVGVFLRPEQRRELIAKLEEQDSLHDFEMEIRHKSGELRQVSLSAERIELQGQRCLLSTLRDVTEIKKSEERHRIILKTAMDGFWLANTEGRLLEINESYCRMSGYSESELLTMFISDLEATETPDDILSHNRKIVATGEDRFESRHRRKDGSIMDVEVSVQYRAAEGGRFVAFFRDITERKRDLAERKHLEEERSRVEAQLRQAQKMEALGTLAGGVAHDFNNILAIISGYAEIASMEAAQGAPIYGQLQQVLKAVGRAKDLVQQILAFSRQSEQEKKPTQVYLIVKEAVKMLRASLPATIEIRSDVESRAVVMADPTQIHQILMNLCTNAAHAMRDKGGVLDVSLTDVHLTPESIQSNSGLESGDHVKLTIRDTGHGIDPSILDKIFDPFFTTKEKGVGTGLGLSVVHGIVKSCGGAIEVESLPGKETTFRVLLPVIESTPRLDAVETTPLPGGRERILVVDDELSLAMALKQMLEHLGYEVDFRTTGADAVEVIRHRSKESPFDLVITDMTMPHLTGTELAKEVFQLQPHPAIILCTGFSEKIDSEKAKGLGIQGFLMKPVVLKELATMVRRVLDARRAVSERHLE